MGESQVNSSEARRAAAGKKSRRTDSRGQEAGKKLDAGRKYLSTALSSKNKRDGMREAHRRGRRAKSAVNKKTSSQEL